MAILNNGRIWSFFSVCAVELDGGAVHLVAHGGGHGQDIQRVLDAAVAQCSREAEGAQFFGNKIDFDVENPGERVGYLVKRAILEIEIALFPFHEVGSIDDIGGDGPVALVESQTFVFR